MTNIKSKLKKIIEAKIFMKVVYIIGIIIVASLIFQAGFFVGFKKASFGHDWNNNYADNFGPSHRGLFMMEGGFGNSRDLPNAHGAIGRIIKTDLPIVTVMDDKDKVEKVVLVNDNTEIRRMRDKINKEDLKVDDFIVVIGDPNAQGQIEAKLIRLLPAPPEMQNINNIIKQ